ncbi:MAG: TIGR01777 family oxidoreductase [Calditrichaeota bacterium]|nr:TIGR01777 family oxidoreductase [Candidatus Cloacimonadota bacterium]MCB1047588.1 TIGR01777 family oxidoreductase [Calditrichota bacterium]MCB9474133.1 TIGR01777 family protein [Candidatus Delongbacteria bacterium]
MKIILPGGSGQAGALLARAFRQDGHSVVVLGREARTEPLTSGIRQVAWDARTLGDWAEELDGADVVINLAGRSVDCRHTPANQRLILESRVNSTRVVGQAIAACSHPPALWLQASAATLYTHHTEKAQDETSGLIGGSEADLPAKWRAMVEVVKAWEGAQNDADTPHTRRVALRISLLLSPDPGGVFAVLLRLVRLGLGGTAGTGRQYVSWIHDRDFVNALRFIIEHPELEGPVNLAAPEPLPNAEFMRILRRAWGMPIGLPAPALLIELGSLLLRTESKLVLKSRRVIPGRLLDSGFRFSFPDWQTAACDLCQRARVRTGEH